MLLVAPPLDKVEAHLAYRLLVVEAASEKEGVMVRGFLGVIAAVGMAGALAAPAGAQTAQTGGAPAAVYVAVLHPMNSKLTGLRSTGEARFTIRDDILTISITAKNVPPNI